MHPDEIILRRAYHRAIRTACDTYEGKELAKALEAIEQQFKKELEVWTAQRRANDKQK